jgi:hypothetical protein
MEQIKNEIIKIKPEFKNNIQMIGDGISKYNNKKNITLCVYNSIDIIKKNIKDFKKIFIDEGHHILKPEIYKNNDENKDEDDYEGNDEDDENKYINIIKDFTKYNNNIYLSATIDNFKNFDYYKKDIREMIDNKYLCDYNIKIPIFSDFFSHLKM